MIKAIAWLLVEPRFIDACRAPVSKVTRENLARTGYLAGPRQVIGQMAPSQAGAREDAPNSVQID